MICDHFRATHAHDATLDLSDLFNVSLQGDDIQDSEVSEETVLERIVQDEDTRVCSSSDCIRDVRTRN